MTSSAAKSFERLFKRSRMIGLGAAAISVIALLAALFAVNGWTGRAADEQLIADMNEAIGAARAVYTQTGHVPDAMPKAVNASISYTSQGHDQLELCGTFRWSAAARDQYSVFSVDDVLECTDPELRNFDIRYRDIKQGLNCFRVAMVPAVQPPDSAMICGSRY